MKTKILNKILGTRYKRVVRVVSWFPCWDSFMGCVGWPTMVADDEAGNRVTTTPMWDRHRLFRSRSKA